MKWRYIKTHCIVLYCIDNRIYPTIGLNELQGMTIQVIVIDSFKSKQHKTIDLETSITQAYYLAEPEITGPLNLELPLSMKPPELPVYSYQENRTTSTFCH